MNGKLAIVLPTYRTDVQALHCIRTLAQMATRDIDVFIGDNSEDPAKWDFLRRLADQHPHCHVFCHEKNIGGRNLGFLLQQTNHEFVAPASDDDVFTPEYFLAGRDLLAADSSCAAAGGLFLFATWNQDTLELSVPRAYLEPTPVERLSVYTNGLNAMSYAVYRSDAMTSFNEYLQDRPFWPSYLDQIGSYAMLCAGTYKIDPSRPLFLYNNVNWTAADSLISDGRWFLAAGLPAEFTHLNRIAWTADVLHYFHSHYRPRGLSNDECDAICQILYNHLFAREFRAHLFSNLGPIRDLFAKQPERLRLIDDLLAAQPEHYEEFLRLFVEVLGVFNEPLSRSYEAFVKTSLIKRHNPQ